MRALAEEIARRRIYPDVESYALGLARRVSQYSTCASSQVGAAAVIEEGDAWLVVAVGWNRLPDGSAGSCLDSSVCGRLEAKQAGLITPGQTDYTGVGHCPMLHAEEVLARNIADSYPDVRKREQVWRRLIVGVTREPCEPRCWPLMDRWQPRAVVYAGDGQNRPEWRQV